MGQKSSEDDPLSVWSVSSIRQDLDGKSWFSFLLCPSPGTSSMAEQSSLSAVSTLSSFDLAELHFLEFFLEMHLLFDTVAGAGNESLCFFFFPRGL